MNAGTPDEAVTAHDVRTAQFTLVKRGGYDTQEVDAFLDQVAETLDIIAETQYRAPARPPVEAVETAAPAPAPAPVAAAEAVPQLHDPDGAAQRLLAAAQRTSDALTAEAKSYAEAQRAEADAYAASTRSDADAHAARVTSTAEAQAATIRETAAEEARRVAEATRASLISEIERLETDRERLMGDTERIRRTFEADRVRLLDIVDGLRREISDAGADLPAPESGAAELASDAAGTTAGPAGAPEEPAAAEPASDAGFEVAVAGGADVEAAAAPGTAADDAVDEDDLDDGAAEVAPSRPDPQAEEAAEPEPEPAAETAETGSRAGTIFDIESDPTWSDDDGPPTEAMPALEDRGDRFFDELRSSDDSGLGPLDEDTDAALTAFFESDDDDDESWRRRFGGRG